MSNLRRTIVLGMAVTASAGVAWAQAGSTRDALTPPTKSGTAEQEAAANPNLMTKEQADAILVELKQIKQLLEKQQAQRAEGMTPKQASATEDKVQMSVGSGWHAIGSADAPVTLVEFGDYQCPFCKQFYADAYPELKKNYIDTGKIRFVSRDFPLEFHTHALRAAEAARCAGDQGKYWELHDALYSETAAPDDSVIEKAAEGLSLDVSALQSCIASDKYRSDVQKDAAEAAALQISGTPTFVLAKSAKDKLEGVRIVGVQPFVTFQSAIENLLKAVAAAETVPSGRGN